MYRSRFVVLQEYVTCNEARSTDTEVLEYLPPGRRDPERLGRFKQ